MNPKRSIHSQELQRSNLTSLYRQYYFRSGFTGLRNLPSNLYNLLYANPLRVYTRILELYLLDVGHLSISITCLSRLLTFAGASLDLPRCTASPESWISQAKLQVLNNTNALEKELDGGGVTSRVSYRASLYPIFIIRGVDAYALQGFLRVRVYKVYSFD